tara:strand:- start:1939 stop:2100 length:162 start_codon:yes stop_codon:yes gene_type:complete
MGHFDKINLSDKRDKNETFEEYKIRRKKNKTRIKEHLKGELFWDSREQGTYKR